MFKRPVAVIAILLVFVLGFAGGESIHEHGGFTGDNCSACTARNIPVLENESYRFEEPLPVLSPLIRPDRPSPGLRLPAGSFLSRAPPV